MLEAKELSKIYRPKKGVPVTALDRVSIRFPQTGMVFLLGKSGSGKSTLLNVLGGLDKYDSGEITIRGVSSKAFKQQHFDSYRNTYVGFIFQEYNVLDEFNVGANIALAIELQNRKATDKQINSILEEVDLAGYGDRKPNELSGGQKQRVAIARALVKNPEIIMADEPTGALDSNTGRQVFDTLKKLSKNKLVIVVSHDREFAEQYADRIIELSDGHVISDVELDNAAVEEEKAEGLSYNGSTVEIPAGYHLTEEDREAINRYIDQLSQNAALQISGNRHKKHFKPTDESRISAPDDSKFRLIKSKLPMKSAFKIGASGLKYKKFRLVITILLSCVAFGLFGLADTFGAYNHIQTCTNSIMDTGLNYAAVAKAKRVGEGDNAYWRDYGYNITDEDLVEISKESGVQMQGVYCPRNAVLDFADNINTDTVLTETDFDIYWSNFSGFAEINADVLKNMNLQLIAGALPDGAKDEVAVSEYIFEIFKKASYTDGTTRDDGKGNRVPVYQTISDYNDLIGKVITFNNRKFTVTGIVDTKLDLDRYVDLTKAKQNQSNADKILDYALYNEFSTSTSYSLACVAMVGDGYVDRLISEAPPIYPITNGYIYFWGEEFYVDSNYITTLDQVADQQIIWADGAKTALGEKEIIVTSDVLSFYDGSQEIYKEDGSIDYAAALKKLGKLDMSVYNYDDYESTLVEDYQVVGVIPIEEKNENYRSTVVLNESLFKTYTEDGDGYYEFAVGVMPQEREEVHRLVSYCYREDAKIRYPLQNSVTFELDSVNEALKVLSKYFLLIGIGFAVFAALMLANFIGTSISYKKQEIGILRAIGSRSNDVFRIFFAESFIIAMINFLLSAIGVFAATAIINYAIRSEAGILITILSFNLRQIGLLLAVSLFVAFLASYIPVKRIASKRPIDAIRDR